jgi:AsmA protein
MSEKKGRKWIIFMAGGIVLILLIAAIVAIPFLLDINHFKPEIESRLSQALGREVTVGSLKLSLLAGGITVDDIEISDNPSFSQTPFITARSLNVEVELQPLIFSRELHITGIALDGPEISLLRAPSGIWNFSDLSREPSDRKPGAEVVIGQVRISNGKVIIAENGEKPSVYENVSIDIGNLSFDTSFPFLLSATLPGGGTLRMQGEAGPLNPADAYLTPLKADLEINRFDLVGSGFVDGDAGLAGMLDLSGAASSDGRQFYNQGQAVVSNLQVAKGGSPAGRPVSIDYTIDYNLAGRRGAVRDASVGYGQAIVHLNGSFEKRGEQTVLNMKMQGTDLPVQDLAELLPAFGIILPRGASLQGGTLDVDLTSEGPLEELVTAGTADIADTRLIGFDLTGRIADVAKFAGLQPGKHTEIETFSSRMRLSPEGIRVDSLLLIVPALGTLSGVGIVSPEQNLDFVMQAVLKPEGALGAALSQFVRGGTMTVPFFVRGTASDPQFVPDTRKAAGGILDSILGGRKQQNDQQDGQQDDQQNGQKRDLEEQIEDVLRGLFKRSQ